MFGYIRTDTPELRVRENEYYKAVYCGMCRAQGKCTGQCSRMTLSYDMVFLALLRLAISGENPTIKSGRCIAHPLKRRPYLDFCDSLAYCAYASALLVWGKTADDINDEKGLKRLKARLTKPLARKMRKKALKHYSELDEKINNGLKKLSEVEKEKLPSVDAPATRFGELLADILSFGVEGDNEKILRSIGLHVGKWIYIIDAVDDIEGDLKNSRFNPFICLYGAQNLGEDQKLLVATSLKLELLAAEPAFDLIEFGENPNIEGIIKNIIYRGMPDVVNRILELDGKSKRGGKKTSQDKTRKVK